jgi:hypothetical protein
MCDFILRSVGSKFNYFFVEDSLIGGGEFDPDILEVTGEVLHLFEE